VFSPISLTFEVRMDRVAKSAPHVPLWDLTANLVRIALQSSVSNYDRADRSWSIFPRPVCRIPISSCEKLFGGSANSPLYGSLTELLQILQPQLERMRITTAQTIAMDGLESRRRDAVIEARNQIYRPAQLSAWARLRTEFALEPTRNSSTPNLHHPVHLSNGAASLHLLPQT
jgi:hypothetical protein